MPKFKAVIREQEAHKTKDGTYDVKIRVTHEHKSRYIGTGYYVLPGQIDDSGQVINHPNASHYNIQIRNLMNRFDQVVADLGQKIRTMDMKSLIRILRDVDSEGEGRSFFVFAEKVVYDLYKSGRMSYAKSIEFTISEIKAFSGRSLVFNEITPEYLERFGTSQRIQKKAVNTTAIHLRNIRMIFNRAIDAGKVSLESYPFRRFKIKQEAGTDKDLDIEDLRKLRNAKLKHSARIRARDLFMLSFYLCGINFKDLLYVKKTDIQKDRLIVKRLKTSQPLSIRITPEAQVIIDKYRGDKYLLSFMEKKLKLAKKGRKSIIHKDIISQTNAKLKEIAKDFNIPGLRSTYNARHTWSSIAFNECEVSEEIIALALGHASQRRVTAGYIRKKYDQVDRANEMVITALNQS